MSRLTPFLLLTAVSLSAACFHHDWDWDDDDWDIRAVLVADDFNEPLWVGSPPGDNDRLFVVEQRGLIWIIDEDNDVLSSPFLDLRGLTNGGGEQGLLGMAFHRSYGSNGRFFVNYTDLAGDTQVVEYQVSSNDDVADPNPVQTILSLAQPFGNHNGGHLAFGPDGKLYIGTGDGGSANDPDNRAQNGLDNLGKMLRLDVDIPPPFIPADNPFVGDPNVNDEIWALGLRNPWRYSFDRLTGDLYIADVGQNAREEISFQHGNSIGGQNYGWRCMEGFTCTGLSGCTCNDTALTTPIHEYSHSGGNCSITGGFVYRGSDLDDFRGHYFFADYCSGRIWTFFYDVDDNIVRGFRERSDELDPRGASISRVTSFGEDASGELYIVDAAGGQIFRIVDRDDRFFGPQDSPGEGDCGTLYDSEGRLARLTTTGSTSLTESDLHLTVVGAAPRRTGFFLYGGARSETPLGRDGRCVGAGKKGLFRTRHSIPTDAAGTVELQFLDEVLTTPEGSAYLRAGTTWHLQYVYRDRSASGMAASDVVTVGLRP